MSAQQTKVPVLSESEVKLVNIPVADENTSLNVMVAF